MFVESSEKKMQRVERQVLAKAMMPESLASCYWIMAVRGLVGRVRISLAKSEAETLECSPDSFGL